MSRMNRIMNFWTRELGRRGLKPRLRRHILTAPPLPASPICLKQDFQDLSKKLDRNAPYNRLASKFHRQPDIGQDGKLRLIAYFTIGRIDSADRIPTVVDIQHFQEPT